MILIEGLDNTGKDTLIESLRRSPQFSQHPTISIHNGAPPKVPIAEISHTMHEAFCSVYTAAADFPGYTFVNRGHVSGAVYDHRYRGTPLITDLFARQESFLDEARDVIVYLYAQPDELLSRDDGKSTYSDAISDLDKIHAIAAEHELFCAVLAASKLPVIMVDTARPHHVVVSEVLTRLPEMAVLA